MASSDRATVGGGRVNTASGIDATVGGGQGNMASGDRATVGGGRANTVSGTHATVSGGFSSTASGDYATVGGGRSNAADTNYGTVGGGQNNTVTGDFATISGGFLNAANNTYATVGGGRENVASSTYTAIGGGFGNRASGYAASVPGGRSNSARGHSSFAAGYRAIADHDNSFVWSDGTTASSGVDSLVTSAQRQFLVKATGGVSFYSNADTTTGVYLAPSTGAWASVSDVNAKTGFNATEPTEVLERLADVPIQTWRYKGQDESITHMGPTAQDFYAAFGLGIDDRHIVTVDADGVALAAIQGLYELVQELQAENKQMRAAMERAGIE